MARQFLFPFFKKEKITSTTYSFHFSCKNDGGWNFLAGQYVRVTLPHENVDDWGSSRFFTITSSPRETGTITITTTVGSSSFKKTLFSLREGDPVNFFGPLGTMTLHESNNYIFLAGGIGINPFLVMIRYANETKLLIPMTLLVSWKSTTEMLYHNELTGIAKTHAWLTYMPTITNNKESTRWNGYVGRIDRQMIEAHCKYNNPIFYVTGPTSFITTMLDILQTMEISEENIKTEIFTVID